MKVEFKLREKGPKQYTVSDHNKANKLYLKYKICYTTQAASIFLTPP